MVYFIRFHDSQKGIVFGSTKPAKLTAKIIDGYTGLCTYSSDFEVIPGMEYFFNHFKPIFDRRFEIIDKESESVLLRISAIDQAAPNLENLDKFGKLKNLNYDRTHNDKQAGLPVYEIFCAKIYDNDFVKVEPGDVVFDIGANIGLFSYSAICNGAKEVHAFEPSTQAANVIRENFKFEQIILTEAAVSDINGEISFYLNNDDSIISSIYQIESLKTLTPIKVASIKLSDYLKNNSIQKIDYLKIDCEGSEYSILKELPEEFLKTSVKKMAVEYHLNTDDRLSELLSRLKTCGFEIKFEFSPAQINDEGGIFYAINQRLTG